MSFWPCSFLKAYGNGMQERKGNEKNERKLKASG